MGHLVLALEEGEKVRGGEEGDSAGAGRDARHKLETHKHGVVIGDDGDQAKLANEKGSSAAGEEPCVSVEESLSSGEELKLVGEREQLLKLGESAHSLELGEDASLLGSRQKASLSEVGSKLELLDARKQAKRRLLQSKRDRNNERY